MEHRWSHARPERDEHAPRLAAVLFEERPPTTRAGRWIPREERDIDGRTEIASELSIGADKHHRWAFGPAQDACSSIQR